nr:hypothetical transcript [Hymenolepis microstoma]
MTKLPPLSHATPWHVWNKRVPWIPLSLLSLATSLANSGGLTDWEKLPLRKCLIAKCLALYKMFEILRTKLKKIPPKMEARCFVSLISFLWPLILLLLLKCHQSPVPSLSLTVVPTATPVEATKGNMNFYPLVRDRGSGQHYEWLPKIFFM